MTMCAHPRRIATERCCIVQCPRQRSRDLADHLRYQSLRVQAVVHDLRT